MRKLFAFILSVTALACSMTATISATTAPRPTRAIRDYHALYDNRPAMTAPVTDTRKAGYE